MKTSIYLDIDGVLLANDLNPANYAEEFLTYILTNFPDTTYWLTTHCKGDAAVPVAHIGHHFSDTTVELLRKIKPTTWDLAKTEAIDFSKPFIWFDDDLFVQEVRNLKKHGVLDNWIEVDLRKDENALKKFVDQSFPLPVDAKV